jgi:hypothetical protein
VSNNILYLSPSSLDIFSTRANDGILSIIGLFILKISPILWGFEKRLAVAMIFIAILWLCVWWAI